MRRDVCHDACVLPYIAYLRIYQPITAFSSRERAYWEVYAESPERPRRVGAVAAEHAESLRRLVATPPIPAPEQESTDAYVRRIGNDIYVCPWQTRLRSWLGLREFRSEFPAGISTAFLPGAAAEAAESAFQRWRDRGEPLRTQILTSTWTIPLPWFLPFTSGERCLALETGPDPASARGETGTRIRCSTGEAAGEPRPIGGRPPRTLLYVTEASRALGRLEHAIGVLRKKIGDTPVLEAAERLEDWLSGVAHPNALLELDYGGLVHLLGDQALRGDESVAEVAAAITGLETDQRELAVGMYRRTTYRWASVQALEHAN